MEEQNGIPKPPTPIPKPPPLPVKRSEVITKKEIVYKDINIHIPPPNAQDLEEVVIGALLVDSGAAKVVLDYLDPSVFYNEDHKRIFIAIMNLYQQRIGVDLLTVCEELRRLGDLQRIGGEFYLIQLTQKVSSAAHIDFHSRILIQKYVLRELVANSIDVMEQCLHRDPDIFDLMDSVKANISRISDVALRNNGVVEVTPEEEFDQRVALNEQGIPPGVRIDLDEFDDWSGGLHDRELIVIAARPGMGKTTAVVAITASLSIDRSVRTAMYSLEMSKTDINYRYAARMTGIPYKKIRNIKDLSGQEIVAVRAALRAIKGMPLLVSDTTDHNNNLENIIESIKEEVKLGCKIVFIDYVQLIQLTNSRGSETSDLNVITGRLKALANSLKIPIVILAQLNRDVDKRQDKRPILADLKQSGSIEQDADTVIFFVRPAYYKQQETKIEAPPHIAGQLDWIVAKGRNIGTRDFQAFLDFHKYSLQDYTPSKF